MAPARANGLGTEDRRSDGNRDRRELHVRHDLVYRAISGGGLRAVAVHQKQHGNFGNRNGDHRQPGGQPDFEHLAQNDAVNAQVFHKAGIGGERVGPPVLLLQQVPGRPGHGDEKAHTRRIRTTGYPHLWQPHPATDQRRGDQQADGGGNQQRAQRRGGVTHTAQHGRDQQKREHAGRGDQHDAGVFGGAGQDVRWCAQSAQHRLGERAAKQGDHQARAKAHGEGGARNRLDALRLFRAPGLPDQHRRARAQTDHESDQKEQHRKERRHRGHGAHAQHLPEVNVVDRAGQRLQDIADNHRPQKSRVDLP